MKLGARMLKTGLAVAIALYITNFIGLPSATYAAIAAAFAIQPNIHRSFQTVLEQIYANVIGVSIGTFAAFSLGNDPIVIGFITIIIILICAYFKMSEDTIALAIIAVLAVMETTDTALLQFAGGRFGSLMIGILAAFIVNMIFLQPKYEIRLFKNIDQVTSDIIQWLRISTRHLDDDPALKGEITRLRGDFRFLDQTYLLFSEERVYLRKSRIQRMRKLVLLRQMISTSRQSLETLQAFHEYDYKIETIPKEFQQVLVDELDKIIYAHERLLLSAMGRIRKQPTKSIEDITDPNIPNLVETLIQVYEEDDKERMALLPLASRLMEYHREIMHLQTLLNSYQHYHEYNNFDFKKKRRRIMP
ncbi:hypothetical protein J416_14342 [Gracilibacillus halophilus YIM-C55.5]|uniref:Aromatic acid exporter family protein n=1 Tax=Gracilibacillus halophilus YIM-C55.5 TaxID=1308866 RepID=N4WHV0_9BACI|nr:aromatic acid exporter family protein [Gracilibacillus halophilus]ENH95752.1 hypothetical protein J416_14342 [Gracilibacillus halophilus YIM-C55.5]